MQVRFLTTASAVALLIPNVAFAQAAPADGAQMDIVVTAQKRPERAQNVPISLTALSGEDLSKANVSTVLDLPRVAPGFFANRVQQTSNTRLTIRGIGTAGNAAIEPSVGAFVDGIYIPRPGPLLAALNDVSGVEVLRGPQGTLSGRNASMGAILFSTTAPRNESTLNGSLEGGSYGRIRASVIANAALSDLVAVRTSVLWDRTTGTGFNVLNNTRVGRSETLSLRGALKAALAPNVKWTLRGDYQRGKGDGQAVVSVDAATVTPAAAAGFLSRLGGRTPLVNQTYSYQLAQQTGGSLNDQQGGVASDMTLDLDGYTVRLLSGYREWRNRQYEADAVLTPALLFDRTSRYASSSHSQELQLISPDKLLDGHLRYVFGVYYFRERYSIDSSVNLGADYCPLIRLAAPARLAACLAGSPANAAANSFSQVTKSYASYLQPTITITPNWDVTAGVRWTRDEKTGSLVSVVNNGAAGLLAAPDNTALATASSKSSYRINTAFRPMPGVMLFATYSTGFKSGGFDTGTGATLGAARVFQPETTRNLEIGFKSQFANRAVTVNATWFKTDVANLQLRSFNGIAFTVRNAASVRQQGLEFELGLRPMRGLSLGLNGIYLDSTFTDFRNAPALPGLTGTQNLTGKRAPYSPKWQGTVSADYETRLGASGWKLAASSRLSFIASADVAGGADGNPQNIQPGYALLGGRLTLTTPGDRFEFFTSGDNLTGRGYCVARFQQTFGGPLLQLDRTTGLSTMRCVLGEPRTFRVGARVKF